MGMPEEILRLRSLGPFHQSLKSSTNTVAKRHVPTPWWCRIVAIINFNGYRFSSQLIKNKIAELMYRLLTLQRGRLESGQEGLKCRLVWADERGHPSRDAARRR